MVADIQANSGTYEAASGCNLPSKCSCYEFCDFSQVNRFQSTFTLIELLVVIIIIAGLGPGQGEGKDCPVHEQQEAVGGGAYMYLLKTNVRGRGDDSLDHLL